MPSGTPSEPRQVMEAIRDSLRTQLTNFDLRSVGGTHRVVIAEPDLAGPLIEPPYVAIGPPNYTPQFSDIGGLYVSDFNHLWMGVVSPDRLDPEGVICDVVDLGFDVVRRIQAAYVDRVNFPVLYGLESLLVTASDHFGGITETMGPEYGIVLGTITWRLHLEGTS